MMKVLITVPHVFAPRQGSLYSSQNASKQAIKQVALKAATIDNLIRHNTRTWVHASLGKGKPVITREFSCSTGVDLTIQVYSPGHSSLVNTLDAHPSLKIIETNVEDYTMVPGIASRRAIEQASDYDLIGYMEDDILIEDSDLFEKISLLVSLTGGSYAFLPHRCEMITSQGDVILSGDPDGGRPDLFWATGETIEVSWPLGARRFYRATNPHSGCFFLSSEQAHKVHQYWLARSWQSSFQLSGPLEQACSGILLPVLKLMKPIPAHYRFLMVRHQDELWQRHPFEQPSAETKPQR